MNCVYRQPYGGEYIPDQREEPKEEPWPECPVCHCECETFILDDGLNIIGCENCMTIIDAVEHLNDQAEAAKEWAAEMLYQDEWERRRECECENH